MSEQKQKSENLNYGSLHSDRKRKENDRTGVQEPIAPPKGSRKERKRVGRGRSSGMGKTSSRGQKGQKSRSGYSHTAGFEGGQMPLHRRVPKRGFTNIWSVDYQEVNLFRLDRAGLSGAVGPAELAAKGLIRDALQKVKILGTGEIKAGLQITADAVSESAKKKIEAAGGSVSLREPRQLRKEITEAKRAARKSVKQGEAK